MNIKLLFSLLLFPLVITLNGFNFNAPDLIANPSAILSEIHAIYDEFSNQVQPIFETSTHAEVRNKLTQLIDKYTAKCPIFFLGECVKEDWSACSLSRSFNPSARRHCENKVVEALVEKISAADGQTTHYVAFASGGMFQDLVTLTKTLSKKPTASLTVHLIDLTTVPYVCCRNIIGNTREILLDYTADPEPIMKEYMQEASKMGGDQLPQEELRKRLTVAPLREEVPAKQFLTYLKTQFPRANITLHIHDTVDNYLTYITKYNLAHADVISTADIEDEMSLLSRSTSSYQKLCIETLRNKPSSKNFWLSKVRGTSKAQLHSYSLNQQDNAQKIVDGEAYIRTEQITPSMRDRIPYLGFGIENRTYAFV